MRAVWRTTYDFPFKQNDRDSHHLFKNLVALIPPRWHGLKATLRSPSMVRRPSETPYATLTIDDEFPRISITFNPFMRYGRKNTPPLWGKDPHSLMPAHPDVVEIDYGCYYGVSGVPRAHQKRIAPAYALLQSFVRKEYVGTVEAYSDLTQQSYTERLEISPSKKIVRVTWNEAEGGSSDNLRGLVRKIENLGLERK